MRKHSYIGPALVGLVAGAVAGLFGAGGGMVLVPLLTLLPDMTEDAVFPSSIAIILPVCITALAVTALTGTVDWRSSIPYLLGSGAGGYIAGRWGRRVPVKWLHRLLGGLILWGGLRYLC